MSHARTAKQLAKEIERITGEPARVHGMWFYGLYLEVAGSQHALGTTPWEVLSPADQESICRLIGRPDLISLLGLDAPTED